MGLPGLREIVFWSLHSQWVSLWRVKSSGLERVKHSIKFCTRFLCPCVFVHLWCNIFMHTCCDKSSDWECCLTLYTAMVAHRCHSILPHVNWNVCDISLSNEITFLVYHLISNLTLNRNWIFISFVILNAFAKSY